MSQEPLAPVLKLTLEFDGGGYHGWQSQPDRRTIQDEVERAVLAINGARAPVHGCGRTDAGVSARGYVASFVPHRALPPDRWRLALNHHLPPAIRVRAVEPAPAGFHARFSARWKHYHYLVVLGRSPLRRGRAWELREPVDFARVGRAAREFAGRPAGAQGVGARDYRAFCQVRDKSGDCIVREVAPSARGDEIEIRVVGDRFLYKMVRRIVGATVAYGTGRLTLADIRSALAGRPHRLYHTAPAHGLLLDRVEY